MPAPRPGQPIAPGVTTTPDKYPQWGVGNVGGKWNTVEAKNAGDKQADMTKGYLVWFSNKTDADNFAQDQMGFASGNVPNPVSWALKFGNFGGLLVRGLKILIGGVLLVAGILKMSGADKKLEQVLPLVGGPAGKVLKA